ncbi:hypothetical protein C8Q76DRAFT_745951 [Earliella scabrosa]|nr:hypothetical protein C8Q76DRAFT_745951 [Earliella scabrosa]
MTAAGLIASRHVRRSTFEARGSPRGRWMAGSTELCAGVPRGAGARERGMSNVRRTMYDTYVGVALFVGGRVWQRPGTNYPSGRRSLVCSGLLCGARWTGRGACIVLHLHRGRRTGQSCFQVSIECDSE